MVSIPDKVKLHYASLIPEFHIGGCDDPVLETCPKLVKDFCSESSILLASWEFSPALISEVFQFLGFEEQLYRIHPQTTGFILIRNGYQKEIYKFGHVYYLVDSSVGVFGGSLKYFVYDFATQEFYALKGWSIKSVWNSPGGVQKYQNHDYVQTLEELRDQDAATFNWRKDLCAWYDEEVIDD